MWSGLSYPWVCPAEREPVYLRECVTERGRYGPWNPSAKVRLVAVRELEAHGAQDSAGLVSGPTLQHFLVSLCLWMNPEQANTAVIRGKKSDGFEAQTAFIKVLTFIGLYFYK